MSAFPPGRPPGPKQHPYQRGDRVILEHTTDPCTRLTPGTRGTVTGYDARHGQLHVAWDDGSTLSMLPGDGDQVRLLTPARTPGRAPWHPAGDDGTGETTHEKQEKDEDGEHPAQDITDPATGLSRLLAQRCSTCILRPGDRMHLGPQRTAEFIRQALDRGTYVVCHQTLTHGDHPGYGPAICRGFFGAYATRSPALRLLRAFGRLIEVPPPAADQEPAGDITSAAGKLGHEAGKAAASWLFGGNTPEQAYRRVLRGIEEGDPEILDAWQPPSLSEAGDYTEAGLAADLGLADGDPAMAGAAQAYRDAACESFWLEAERLARSHLHPPGC